MQAKLKRSTANSRRLLNRWAVHAHLGFFNDFQRDIPVKTIQRLTGSSVALAVLIGLGGCSGMSRQDQNTAVGAGVGGVAGAVLTDGSAIGTVGGAVVGGIIGHEIDSDNNNDRDRRDGDRRDGDRDRNR